VRPAVVGPSCEARAHQTRGWCAWVRTASWDVECRGLLDGKDYLVDIRGVVRG
jgi:hypothetical protein